jgi:hypothetical protein
MDVGSRRSSSKAAVWLIAAALLALVATDAAIAAAPFARGMLLKGTVVTTDADDRVLHRGNVLIRDGRIAGLWRTGHRPSRLKVGRPLVVAPPGALIYPGLINLHDHPTYSMRPPIASNARSIGCFSPAMRRTSSTTSCVR